jgi:hypothetical protein
MHKYLYDNGLCVFIGGSRVFRTAERANPLMKADNTSILGLWGPKISH